MDALKFSSDVLEVAVLPRVGARLHRIRAFGQDLLRTPFRAAAHELDPFFWGAYVMAPWCNRLDARRTRFGNRWVNLPANFPDGSAIHGQVYARPWQVDGRGRLSIRGGGDAWPWEYEVRMRIVVSGAGLHIGLELSNVDNEPMPAGLGIHPWFRKPLEFAIHGRQVMPDNLDPSSPLQAAVGEFDLRGLGDVPDDMDATWTDLADPAVELLWPRKSRAVMHLAARRRFVVAASPAALDAIAVEPQTHAPYGLSRLLGRQPGGLALLEPGETMSLQIGFLFEPLSP